MFPKDLLQTQEFSPGGLGIKYGLDATLLLFSDVMSKVEFVVPSVMGQPAATSSDEEEFEELGPTPMESLQMQQ